MIASLPMYFRSETESAHRRLWVLIRDRLRGDGIDAPDDLSAPADLVSHWQLADILLSQTCGLPFATFLKQRAYLVGSSDHEIPGCPAGHYYSVFIKAKSDRRAGLGEFSGAKLAINGKDSQSGWGAPLNEAKARRMRFGSFIETGSHRESSRAVASGAADIAAIDAHSWRLITRYDDFADRLCVFDSTPCTPGTPLITCHPSLVSHLRRAITSALSAYDGPDRFHLPFRRCAQVPESEYFAVPEPIEDFSEI